MNYLRLHTSYRTTSCSIPHYRISSRHRVVIVYNLTMMINQASPDNKLVLIDPDHRVTPATKTGIQIIPQIPFSQHGISTLTKR